MPAPLNNNNSSIAPKEFFKPSEIIRIFNDFLARSSASAKVVYLRGIYLKSQSNTAYSGFYYDRIKDEDDNEKADGVFYSFGLFRKSFDRLEFDENIIILAYNYCSRYREEQHGRHWRLADELGY